MSTSRPLLYVAMTRGRHANTTYLYDRVTAEDEFGHRQQADPHLTCRGDREEAANLLVAVITKSDDPPITAHAYAANVDCTALPNRVRLLLDRRAGAVSRRRAMSAAWITAAQSKGQSWARVASPRY